MNLHLFAVGAALLAALACPPSARAQGCATPLPEFPAWAQPQAMVPAVSDDPLFVPWAAEMMGRLALWSAEMKVAWAEPMAQRLTAVACENEAIKARVETLESRMQALESALQALQNNQPKPSPAPAPASSSRVTAPFVVVDATGREVLKVVSADGVDSLSMGNIASESAIQLVRKSNMAIVVAKYNGNAFDARLQADATAAAVTAYNHSASARLGSGADNKYGVFVRNETPGKDNQPITNVLAELAVTQGQTGGVLRLRDKTGGKQIVAAGENPSTPGTGLIYVGNGGRNAAALATNADGSGVVHVFAADGRVGAGMNGNDRNFVAYSAAGTPITSVGKSDKSEGGNVTVYNPSGDGVASMGNRADRNNGEICVLRGGSETKLECLGISLPGLY